MPLRVLASLHDGSEEFRLLARLFAFFDGRHSFEDIIWRTGVKRAMLTKVVIKYEKRGLLRSTLREAEPFGEWERE